MSEINTQNATVITDYFCNLLDDGTVCLYGGGWDCKTDSHISCRVGDELFIAYKVGEVPISKIPFIKGRTNGSTLPDKIVKKIKELL